MISFEITNQIVHTDSDISNTDIIVSPDGSIFSLIDFGLGVHFNAEDISKNEVRGLYLCEQDVINTIDHDLLCLKSMLGGMVENRPELTYNLVKGPDEQFLQFVQQLKKPKSTTLSHMNEHQASLIVIRSEAKRSLPASFIPFTYQGEGKAEFMQKLLQAPKVVTPKQIIIF